MSSPNTVAYDPTLPPREAASYLGCAPRTLRRLKLEREPIPCTGRKRPRFGYKLSTLNQYRERLKNPRARTPEIRRVS